MKKINLKTGVLELNFEPELEEVIGFSSRMNKKRGFLFVSKVLGKHIPSKPKEMKAIHKLLADKLRVKLNKQNTLVIGFAETATGIGNGVFDELEMDNAFYFHTTRYNLAKEKILEFKEEHSHAPSHILYLPEDENLKAFLAEVKNIVLVDDEITTGNTIKNIIKELKPLFPQVEKYFAVSILNWSSIKDENLDFTYLHTGTFEFEKYDYELEEIIVSETLDKKNLDAIIPYNFGRFGIKKTAYDYSQYIDLADLKNKKVLVLGTGEFMYQAYLFTQYLENNGIEAYVQSTTRSPINIDGDILSKIKFKDNYYEQIDNFLYNVIDKNYDKILLCYETTSLPKEHTLKLELEKYFKDVVEIFFES